MSRPARLPIGLHLAQVAKVVSRAFDDALAGAGGSLPVWLVLISLKAGRQPASVSSPPRPASRAPPSPTT